MDNIHRKIVDHAETNMVNIIFDAYVLLLIVLDNELIHNLLKMVDNVTLCVKYIYNYFEFLSSLLVRLLVGEADKFVVFSDVFHFIM